MMPPKLEKDLIKSLMSNKFIKNSLNPPSVIANTKNNQLLFQARANGTVAMYQLKCLETKNKYTGMKKVLANPSNEMRDIFRKLYFKESLDRTRYVLPSECVCFFVLNMS